MKRLLPSTTKPQPTILRQPRRELTTNRQELAVFLDIFANNYPLALLHRHPDFKGLRHALRQFVLRDDFIIEPFKTPIFDGNMSLGHEPNWNAFIYNIWSQQLNLWAFARKSNQAHNLPYARFTPEPANCLQLTPTMVHNRILHEIKNLLSYYHVKLDQADEEAEAEYWKHKIAYATTRAEIQFHDEIQIRTLKEQYEDPLYADLHTPTFMEFTLPK